MPSNNTIWTYLAKGLGGVVRMMEMAQRDGIQPEVPSRIDISEIIKDLQRILDEANGGKKNRSN